MRNLYKMCILLCILPAVLLAGCGSADQGKTAGEEASLQSKSKSASVSEEEEFSPEVAFEGQDMEGNSVSSDIFSESKLTMVNVWATYCSPCLNEMPGLGELAQEYDPEEFQIIGIVSDVDEGAAEDKVRLVNVLIEQTSADYAHVLVNESVYKGLIRDVTAVPTTFFFNKKGELLDTVVGSMEKAAWEEKINAFLEE